ncbi:TetR/AcrR family transcriptional regulator [Nonomuraea sp. NBC_01738]|uniref:TetR/AcrR family transcriptional regulator n=1 Tax=Nonomuraea sp. NBC_01738 TaxID=2976003 RepID=UPI002E158C05|nr:TetR/AcrR family transcriptional regulator [Nonomuraea sp. NBC_01738]
MKTPARDRVLDTATRLFYAEGVHAVGIDRIIAEAGVAKATFYHHFPSKDELVRAYIQDQSRRAQNAAAGLRPSTPRANLLSVFDYMGEIGGSPAYRGCPFVNAAAEYPDPAHPVRQAVAEYRAWFRGLVHTQLVAEGHPDPERTADILMVLRDGLVIGCDLDDARELRPLIRDAVLRVLGDQPVAG